MKTTYIFLGVIAILMWNVFLIQRDKKMFDALDGKIQTKHQQYCEQLKTWHPDCNVE